MEELQLAIDFLKRRALSTENLKDDNLKCYVAILSINEVVGTLERVKDGTFLNWYNEMKKHGHPTFI